MKYNLLYYLSCPKCKSSFDLAVDKDDKQEIIEGNLICKNCKAKYKISNYIPRFFPDNMQEEEKLTINSFSFEWENYGKKLSNNLNTELLTRMHPWKEEDFKGKDILDVGCGAGRLSRLAADYGAKTVFALDLGASIDVARKLSMEYKNIHFIQASIFEMPFKEIFDLEFSIGVLHHTPSPIDGFKKLMEVLNPNGKVGIWVYSKEANRAIGVLINLLRKITLKLNENNRLRFARILVNVEELIYSIITKITDNFYYGDYLRYFNKELSRNDRESTVFDFFSTKIVKYISKNELDLWIKETGLNNAFITRYNTKGNDTKGYALTGIKGFSS